MRFRLSNPAGPLPPRIISLTILTLLLSGWTTCSAMFTFNGCESSIAQPQVTSLSPTAIPASTESTLLAVSGSNFAVQSQIMWNGTALPTTFVSSRLLQTTITQQTLSSVAVGSAVQISVVTLNAASAVAGCPNGGASSTLSLVISE